MQSLSNLDLASHSPGESVTLPAGVHKQPVRFVGVRGTREQPIILRGEGQTVIDVRMRHYAGIELTDCRYLVLQGCVIRNSGYTGLALRHSSYCRVEACRFENCRHCAVLVCGYSIDPPVNPANPWQWYRQLPLARGNTFRDLHGDGLNRGPDLQMEYGFCNEFINCDFRIAHLARSCGNVLVQSTPCALQESDLSANNTIGRAAPAVTRARSRIEEETAGQDRFRAVAREGLAALTGFGFACSEKRLEHLVTQSLYLLAARVDEEGRCAIGPPPALYSALQLKEDPNKDLGSLMAHQARSGRLSALRESLRFVLEITTKPAYVIPDHWEYFRNRDLETVWRGYAQDPDGQYTLGIANCEQTAEWLMFFRKDVLGIRDHGERLIIAPMLPLEIDSFAVSGVPTPWGNVGYRLDRTDSSVELSVARDAGIRAIDVSVPVPPGAAGILVESGEGLVYKGRTDGDVQIISYQLPGQSGHSRISWNNG